MKVRHRTGLPVAYEVLAETKYFYILADCAGGEFSVTKEMYEPVPEPTWRDVTAEVTVKDNGYQGDGNGLLYLNCECVQNSPRYRLRKVQLINWQWAFLIERKD